jgi:hypothetical protein
MQEQWCNASGRGFEVLKEFLTVRCQKMFNSYGKACRNVPPLGRKFRMENSEDRIVSEKMRNSVLKGLLGE